MPASTTKIVEAKSQMFYHFGINESISLSSRLPDAKNPSIQNSAQALLPRTLQRLGDSRNRFRLDSASHSSRRLLALSSYE